MEGHYLARKAVLAEVDEIVDRFADLRNLVAIKKILDARQSHA